MKSNILFWALVVLVLVAVILAVFSNVVTPTRSVSPVTPAGSVALVTPTSQVYRGTSIDATPTVQIPPMVTVTPKAATVLPPPVTSSPATSSQATQPPSPAKPATSMPASGPADDAIAPKPNPKKKGEIYLPR